MVDLVGNRFKIIKILKHKKGQTILIPELSLRMNKKNSANCTWYYVQLYHDIISYGLYDIDFMT